MKHTPMGAGDTTVNSRETRAWPLARWDWSLAAEMGIWHLIVLREGRYKVTPLHLRGRETLPNGVHLSSHGWEGGVWVVALDTNGRVAPR